MPSDKNRTYLLALAALVGAAALYMNANEDSSQNNTQNNHDQNR
ncbi:hypothetical protein OAJ98_02025 [Deltaproteobacteria bacterium]|nr:hypothetical protein [Deltaproteobacteria bacterium]